MRTGSKVPSEVAERSFLHHAALGDSSALLPVESEARQGSGSSASPQMSRNAPQHPGRQLPDVPLLCRSWTCSHLGAVLVREGQIQPPMLYQ